MALTGTDRVLAWSDFRTVDRSPTPPRLAFTSATYNVTVPPPQTSHRAGGGRNFQSPSINISVVLNTRSMWVVDGHSSDALLRHEQGHFDIVAMLARDLYNALSPLIGRSFPTHQAWRDAFSAPIAASDRMHHWLNPQDARQQSPYDAQTHHGDVQQAQDTWNRIFQSARAGTELRAALIANGVQPPQGV